MARWYEGQTLEKFHAIIYDVPAEVPHRKVYQDVEREARGRILAWRVSKQRDVIEPNSSNGNGQTMPGYRVYLAVDSSTGRERLIDASLTRRLMEGGQPLRIVRDERQKRRGNAPVIRMWASSFSLHVMVEENTAERWAKVNRPDLILVEFAFISGHEVLRWVYPDNRGVGLYYQFQLPFKYIIPHIRFWTTAQGEDCVLMGVQMMRRPEVSFFRFDPDNPADVANKEPNPFSPHLELDVETTSEKYQTRIEECLASDELYCARLSTSEYFRSYGESPMQNCDLVAFRFPGRLHNFQTSPLLGNLRRFELTKAKRKNLNPANPSNSVNALGHSPKVEVPMPDSHRTLPFDVRWRAHSLISNDVVTAMGYVFFILPLLEEELQTKTPLGTLCAAMDDFAGRGTGRLDVKYNHKIYNSSVLQEFKACLDNAKTNNLIAETSERLALDKSRKHFLIPRILVTPSRVICQGPDVEMSNRMLRKFAEHAEAGSFIRVNYLQENMRVMLVSNKEDGDYGAGHVYKTLRNGISLYGEHFDFVIYSQSGLRELACWFLRRTSSLNPQDVRDWMGNMSDFRNPAKCASRMGLNLTQTQKTGSEIPAEEYEIIPDIKTPDSRYTFTDGCGFISPEFAETVAIDIGGLARVPSAFQIRFMGCKGMVVQCPLRPPLKLQIRESMRKYDTYSTPLEIAGFSTFRNAYLNREIILLLSALGVPDRVFMRKQDEYVDDILRMLTDERTARHFLYQETFHAAPEWQRDMAALLSSGFPLSEPFLKGTLECIQEKQVLELRTKSKILVKKGAFLYGVCDPTNKELEAGQVVVRIVRRVPGTQNQHVASTITGRVVVVRNPCLHIGDVRVLEAVKPVDSRLRSLENVIVFPVKGTRPHADEMSGGDLDGDQFSVFYDEELLPRRVHLPMDYESAKSSDLERPVVLDDLLNFFVEYSKNATLGVISNCHKVWADQKGAGCTECLRLAELHSQAVDFPKTGVPAQIAPDLRRREYPEYMEKMDRESYESQNVLGCMYRAIVNLQLRIGEATEGSVKWEVPGDLMIDGYREYLPDATADYTRYCHTVRAMMSKYGVAKETEFFAGAVAKHFKVKQKKVDKDFYQKMAWAVNQLKNRYREVFKEGLDKSNPEKEYRKAAAWLHVAYSAPEPAFRSFPWVIADSIARLRLHAKNNLVEEEIVEVAGGTNGFEILDSDRPPGHTRPHGTLKRKDREF